eukprot:1442147-Rhodomonas_salina.1
MLVLRLWKGSTARCHWKTARQKAQRITDTATGVMSSDRNGRNVPHTCIPAVSRLAALSVWSERVRVERVAGERGERARARARARRGEGTLEMMKRASMRPVNCTCGAQESGLVPREMKATVMAKTT